jgi:hypothetical protein
MSEDNRRLLWLLASDVLRSLALLGWRSPHRAARKKYDDMLRAKTLRMLQSDNH